MATAPERTKVFISYSHNDSRDFKRLKSHLDYYEQEESLAVWDDTKIVPGNLWREEIENAIASAKIAILLVSADFLASKFIRANELPPLLIAAQAEGVTILPVILSPCGFEGSNLSQYQAVNPPSKPLTKMSRHEKEVTMLRVAQIASNSKISSKQFSADPTVQVGQRLGNVYRVMEIVGRTNHSLVVKAWDEALERYFAIKLLILNLELSDKLVKQLQDNLLREARILVNLEHQNIGRLYNVMLDPLAVVMQWIEGTSLQKIIDENIHLPITVVLKIGMKLAEVLSYVHARGIIHRDIKPGNIILNESGEPILIDFDIASSEDQDTITRDNVGPPVHVGTKEYSAPEQFENPDIVGPPADVFALGVVLYQTFTHTHQRPYQFGNNPMQYNGQLPKPERLDIPEPLYKILCMLLHQERARRPSASELHNQLQSYLTTVDGDNGNRSKNTLQNHVIFCTGSNHNFINRSSEAEFNTVDFLVANLRAKDAGDYRILVNYNIPMSNLYSREIDVVVINKFGVFLLEVKGWLGNIEAFDDFWIIDGKYKRDNALEAIYSKARILHNRIFGHRGELSHLHNVSVTGLVVLTQVVNRFRNQSSSDLRAVVGLGNQLLQVLSSTQLLQKGRASKLLDNSDIQLISETIYRKHQVKEEELIRNYRILREISFGDLFDAFEAQLIDLPSRRVRLKRYQLLKLNQPGRNVDIRHFSRSMEAVFSLGFHPNILISFDFFPDSERPDVFYEVTELVTGRRLDVIMAGTKKKLSLEEQLDYMNPLCEALGHAHNHKEPNGRRSPVYHRNICPETVFVTNDNIVKLGDFDFAKIRAETISVRGQPLIEKPYTALELLEDPSAATAASDIFALGVLWFFLASLPAQNPKFDPKSAETQIDALQMPEDASGLMKRMVASVPVNRPQSIEDVLNELKRLGKISKN